MPIQTLFNFIQPGLHGTPSTVQVHNARAAQKTLDANGFELYSHHTSLSTADFYEDDTVTSVYYPELAETLRAHTGAALVIPVVHSIRNKDLNFVFDKSASGGSSSVPSCKKKGSTTRLAEYVPLVHCDNTFDDGTNMVTNILARTGQFWSEFEKHLPDHTAMDFDKHRYQVVNVWRNVREEPITIWNHPLAVLDVQTMHLPEDFIQSKTELPKLDGNKSHHEWYYYDKMKKEEILVFSRWDSRAITENTGGSGKPPSDVNRSNGSVERCGLPVDARGVSTFHTSFCNDNPLMDYLDSYVTPGRESIDTLCVLVFDL